MQPISNLELISKLQSITHDCLKDYVSKDEPLAILDFPDIKNCGDSAIWLGEMAYLRTHHNKIPAYVSRMRDFSAESLERIMPSGPIFIHGGGNFGDIWVSHQNFRERVLERFPHRQIIQFPQSIHYQTPERLEKSRMAIGQHKNFVLLVRDEKSKQFAEKHFDCVVRLCPDMAFCIGPVQPASTELPVLAMLREDKEKVNRPNENLLPGGVPKEDWITENARSVRYAKIRGALSALMAGHPGEMRLRMLDAAAHHRFQRGIRQISRGQTIVTDRLHVHICSLLIGRPHAVLDNSYGKIQGFMSTFSGGTNLSYKASSLDDAIDWAHGQASVAINPQSSSF